MTTEQSTASADAPQIPTDIRPQDDLYLHVNGEWIASHTIPDDRSADGVIRGLFDIAEEKVRDIITHAAENTGSDAAAEEARKVADLFASFMDEDRVEELGVQPLEDDFAALEAAGDHDELVRVLGRLERSGSPGALAAYVSADAKDPEHYVLYVHQDGIGLPDESYYREDQHAEVRELYVAHLARMATLTGIDARTGRDAADIAQTVLDLETRFARDHWDVVETRDAQKTYNRMTIDEAAQLADGFDVRGWLTEIGAGDASSRDRGRAQLPRGSGHGVGGGLAG